MKMYSVISGDIVAFTSLDNPSKKLLEKNLNGLFLDLEKMFNTYGRLVKGDAVECVVSKPEKGLCVALILKAFIKSQNFGTNSKRQKHFEDYGLRQVLGYGPLSRFNIREGIIDGEAIYMSGRKINEDSGTHDKARVIIKNTLQFISKDQSLNTTFEALFGLLDFMLNKATRKQCEVVFYKLMGREEDEIAALLGISQSAINQHSTGAGWKAMERAVDSFEWIINKSKNTYDEPIPLSDYSAPVSRLYAAEPENGTYKKQKRF